MTITVADISLEMLRNLSNIGDEGGEDYKVGEQRAESELEEFKGKKTFHSFS